MYINIGRLILCGAKKYFATNSYIDHPKKKISKKSKERKQTRKQTTAAEVLYNTHPR